TNALQSVTYGFQSNVHDSPDTESRPDQIHPYAVLSLDAKTLPAASASFYGFSASHPSGSSDRPVQDADLPNRKPPLNPRTCLELPLAAAASVPASAPASQQGLQAPLFRQTAPYRDYESAGWPTWTVGQSE